MKEENKEEKYIDTGLNKKLIDSVNKDDNESLRDYSHRHRDVVKRAHKLGFWNHKKVCSNCGHSICRCADRRARYELEGKTEDDNA